MKRNPHRIIYTSSYDRGLQHLLEVWPRVIEAVPSAQLHIFYGWQLFEQFYKDNPASMAWMEKMKALMLQKGITDHGRIPQHELKKEYLQSGIWAYPTHFGEINCISALKAQTFGCEPVVVNYAALQETVKYGRKVEGDIYDEETKDAFTKELIEALKHPMMNDVRTKMMAEFKAEYSWEKVASDWVNEFQSSL